MIILIWIIYHWEDQWQDSGNIILDSIINVVESINDISIKGDYKDELTTNEKFKYLMEHYDTIRELVFVIHIKNGYNGINTIKGIKRIFSVSLRIAKHIYDDVMERY